jgi:hypothetical protein
MTDTRTTNHLGLIEAAASMAPVSPLRVCEKCRYWSEMIAMTIGPAMTAMCLKEGGPKHGAMTMGSTTCAAWAWARLGAIDDPRQNPARYSEEPGTP